MGRSLDSRTAAYIASAGWTPPTGAADKIVFARFVTQLDIFVRTLVARGIWDLLDTLYMFAGYDDNSSRINMITPGFLTLSKVNAPIFTQYQGWSQTADSGYLIGSGAYAPYTNATFRLQLDNASIGMATTSNVADTSTAATWRVQLARIHPRSSAGNYVTCLSSGTPLSVVNTGAPTAGLYATSRTNSTGYTRYKRGAPFGSAVVDPSAGGTPGVLYLRTFVVTNPVGMSTLPISMGFTGAALSDDQQSAFNNAWQTFAIYMGLPA